MPPKLASTNCPPRRSSRTNAWKSPNSNLTPSIHSHPLSSTTATANADIPSPSTAVPTFSEPSQETKTIHTYNTGGTLQIPSDATTPASEAQFRSSQENLPNNSGLVKCDTVSVDGKNYEGSGKSCDVESSGVEHSGPGKIIHAGDVTTVGSGDGRKNVVNLSSLQGERPHVQGDGSMKPEIEVAGSGNGKRKIVKKIVRVVKKVIKKRVPKRVLMNASEYQGVVVKAKDSLNIANDLTENSNLVNGVIEKSDVVDRVTEKTSIVRELMENPNMTGELTQKLKLDNTPNASEPISREIGNDLSGIGYMESEVPKVNLGASFSEQIVPANDRSGINSADTDDIKNDDAVSEVDGKDLIIHAPDLIVVEKVNSMHGTITESKEIAHTVTENQSKDFVVENQKIDIVNKADMELLASRNVVPMGEKSVFSGGERNRRMISTAGHGSGEVESDHIKLTEGLLLSGEMEALKGKRRQKAEIFLGGLDKDTKEDDIRKVFEEVGEIVELRLVMNSKTGKNKGFAFLQFATVADAEIALAKYSKVEICGKQCTAEPVKRNDTIFLGNINRNWKTEDVVTLLEKAGIEKIDKVTLKADPNNIEKNRGFAFVELQTSKDAQIAFNRLQKEDAFGKNQMLKVAWAQTLTEPSEEEDFSQVKMAAVSLAKPTIKRKQMKHTSDLTSRELSKATQNPSQTSRKMHEPTDKGKAARSSYGNVKVDNKLSTNDELVQILRQQASSEHILPHPRTGANMSDHHFTFPGSKRPFSLVGHDPLYVEHQGLLRRRVESSYPISGPSFSSQYVGLSSSPYHHPQMPGFTSDSVNMTSSYLSDSVNWTRTYPSFQTREQAPSYNDSICRRRE